MNEINGFPSYDVEVINAPLAYAFKCPICEGYHAIEKELAHQKREPGAVTLISFEDRYVVIVEQAGHLHFCIQCMGQRAWIRLIGDVE